MSPSKERQENKDPLASTAFLDHEEVKVCKELPVRRGTQASMDLQASWDSQDPPGQLANKDPQDHLDVQDLEDSSGSQEKLEIQVILDVQGNLENAVTQDVLDPKVIKEILSFVPVHLVTSGLLETAAP